MKLSVVVPAYNEETTVGGVLRAHVEMGRRLAGEVEVIVCDDGSSDGTAGAIAAVAADLPEARPAQRAQCRHPHDDEAPLRRGTR